MNERYRLNSERIREYLRNEDRKQSFLVRKLGVSQSLVAQMLCDGHVPQAETLRLLADLLGVQAEDLLLPKRAKTA